MNAHMNQKQKGITFPNPNTKSFNSPCPDEPQNYPEATAWHESKGV